MQLFKYCIDYIEGHIEIIKRAVKEAQQAVMCETKTTAGDRYEIERATKQREMELFGKRIEDAMTKRQLLKMIDPTTVYSKVTPGALVSTSLGHFFIAISADEVVINDIEYCMISIDSPIGSAMNNKSVGAAFFFRGKNVVINEIY